jgi:hypothetical protein
VQAIVDGSSLMPVYGPAVDSRSAFEKLTGAPVPAGSGSSAGSSPASTTADGPPPQPTTPPSPADIDAEARRIEETILGRPSTRPASPAPPAPDSQEPGPAPGPDNAPPRQPGPRNAPSSRTETSPQGSTDNDALKDFALQSASVLGRELMRGLFGTRRRRRRW